jgi:hypothetical protein
MIISKKALRRRTFLRGMGTAVALPLLDAMVPAMTALAATPAKPVRRLGFVYIPMGAHMPEWTPATDGPLTELPSILRSLAPFKDRLTVLTNLELKNGYSPGNHATANSSFLSAAKAKMTEGSDYELATTVDQVAAKQIGKDTALPSLELGMDLLTTVGNCDNGFACVYQNNLSWSSPTTPLPAEAHPRNVFERLFGDGGSASERRSELQKNASILDWVTADLAHLQRKLGAGDRTKLNEYLETIREVERRIQKAEKQTSESPLPDVDRPVGVPASYGDHAKLMWDLQALALQGDITRVITFQLAREASTRTYPEAGVSDPHHPVSHHQKDPEKLAKLAKINAYHVSLFAYFLEKLRSIPDGDGSMLDHTMYLFGSGMGDPDAHDHANLPIVVAGGGGGRVRGGKHIRYKEPTPLANVHLTLLHNVGVKVESFADSQGTVPELLAL